MTQLTEVAETQSQVQTPRPCRCLTISLIRGIWTCGGLGMVISLRPSEVWRAMGSYVKTEKQI